MSEANGERLPERAVPKDHEKSMPTPLKFDRTCHFDICVRKRRVARGAIVLRLKSKQHIRPPAIFTLLKVCSEYKVIKENWKSSLKAEVNEFCKICSCTLKSSVYFMRVSTDLKFVAYYCWQTNVRIASIR